MWVVKYLSWKHKIKTVKIQAFTESQVEKTISRDSDVKCILDIKQEGETE